MFERTDRYVGLGFVVLGALCFYDSTGWKKSFASDPAGPAAIPKILCIGLILLGLVLAIGGFLCKKKPEGRFITGQELITTLVLCGICVAYILLLKIIGYLLATPLLIASVLVTVGMRKPKPIILISLITTIILFFLFYSLLRVNLPLGFMKKAISSIVPRI